MREDGKDLDRQSSYLLIHVFTCIPADSSRKLLADINDPDVITQVEYIPSGNIPDQSVTVE